MEIHNNDQRRILLAKLIGTVVLLVSLITGLLYYALHDWTTGEAICISEVLDQTILLDGPDYSEVFTENYIAYLYKAYIVFGEYPDVELYKINSAFKRTDYDFENDFYIPDGGTYRSYFPDGEKAENARIAIDVSEYQGEIDWKEVKAAGVDVVMVRAGFRGYGSGKLEKDTMVCENIEGAITEGLSVGVYFFSQAVNYEEGVEEAQFVLDLVRGYQLTEPIVIDSEFIYGEDSGSARGNLISAKERTDGILGFCETIEAAGNTPMIYASKTWLIQENEFDRIGQYEIWIAAYYDDLVFPYHTEGWQYSPEGYVPGIDTEVDLNVWLR